MRKLKILIGTVLAVLSVLMLTQPIYAFRAQLNDAPRSNQSAIDINTGFIIGAHDAADKCQPECHAWIDLPGNGFANKTQEFIRGYIYGWCSNPDHINGAGREDDYNADFDCDRGPNSASWDVQQLPPKTGPTELPNMPQVNNTMIGTPSIPAQIINASSPAENATSIPLVKCTNPDTVYKIGVCILPGNGIETNSTS